MNKHRSFHKLGEAHGFRCGRMAEREERSLLLRLTYLIGP